MTARWRGRRVRQQDRRAAIDMVGTEHPARGRDLAGSTREPHGDATQMLGAGGGCAEVVVAPHAVSVPEPRIGAAD